MIDYEKYMVLDLETTVKNFGEQSIGNNKADPNHPDNYVVMSGHKMKGHTKPSVWTGYMSAPQDLDYTIPFLLVGQNIRFDLTYLANYDTEWYHYIMHSPLWDTQLAEYILNGQTTLYPSLDEMAPHYGGTVKMDVIKDMWDSGVQTEDMPVDLLSKYLADDVKNTEIVFLGQLKRAHKTGMLPLIESQMRALKATWVMQRNGMFFAQGDAKRHEHKLESQIQTLEGSLAKRMSYYFPKDMPIEQINPGSNDQLSALLFGGYIKYITDQVVTDADGNPVKFKSGARKGQVKTKKETIIGRTTGFDLLPDPTWKNKKGMYNTNDFVLQTILSWGGVLDVGQRKLIEDLIEYRRLKKDYKTYFVGYRELVWPDGCIHGNINHCATATGRLSSTSPNLQNVSSKDT